MQWDLSPLYRGFDDPALLADFQRGEDWSLEDREFFAAGLPVDGERLYQAVRRLERMANLCNALEHYLLLTLAVDATNEPALALRDRLLRLLTESQLSRSAFARLAGEAGDLETLLSGDERLAPYAFFIREAAARQEHLLEPSLEDAVLRMQVTGGRAWEQLRDLLDGTALVELDGRQIPLSAARNLAYSPDAATRRRAYEAELAAYPAFEGPMAACLNGIKGEALTLCEWERFGDPLEATLFASRMDRQTLDAMWAAIAEYAPKFRQYLRAKARLLGHDNGLPFYDLFAPIGEGHKRFTLEQAQACLVEVLGRFNPRMAAFVDQAFRQRWIDAEPRPGKQGGAFCADIHSRGVSRILANFEGSFSDVLTLAHELGHGYHNLCMQSLSILNTDVPMPLAETASIFNETLVLQDALANAGEGERLALLEAELMEVNQVILDIYSRYLFETEVFRRRRQRALPAAELKELMLDAQRQAYGDGLDPQYLHPYMWACKSHYYSPDVHFYNFPYAFGQLFGRGVYAVYRREGQAFLPAYDGMLARGGRDTVANVAGLMGADVRDPAFWCGSLASYGEEIDEYLRLAVRV